jgi:hypothetical protein
MLPIWQVPVAYSMVALANRVALTGFEPFQSYMCYWSAFNSIYVTLTEQEGKGPKLRRDEQGCIKTRQVAGIDMPTPRTLSERDQISLAFTKFSPDLKHILVVHPSTEFFVHRTPSWHGQKIEHDPQGRRLNGVLNIGYTVDADHPVWAPINQKLFERYRISSVDSDRDVLAKQILDVLYAVRNNTFHGGKRADDANDRKVIEKAFPLLKKIVVSFLQDEGSLT